MFWESSLVCFCSGLAQNGGHPDPAGQGNDPTDRGLDAEEGSGDQAAAGRLGGHGPLPPRAAP